MVYNVGEPALQDLKDLHESNPPRMFSFYFAWKDSEYSMGWLVDDGSVSYVVRRILSLVEVIGISRYSCIRFYHKTRLHAT